MKKLILSLLCVVLCTTGIFAAITSNAVTGNWSDGSTWVDGIVPASTDDVILVAGANITLTANADCKSITYPTTLNGNTTINLAGFTLSVTGNVTVGVAGTASTTNWLNIGAGTMSCNDLTINGATTGTKVSKVSITTGTLTINGAFSIGDNNNEAQKIVEVGAGGTLVFNGTVSKSRFTFTLNATSTVKYLKAGDKSINSAESTFNGVYGNLVLGGGGNTTLNWAGISIATSLTLDGTVFKLGSNNLTMNNTATLNSGVSNPYSSTNMIETNASTGGYGRLIVNSNTAAGFQRTYPVGLSGVYSPLVISALTATVGTGSLSVRVVDAKHPLITNNNHIKRYWDVATTNITAISALTGYMQYTESDVVGTESNMNTVGSYASASGVWNTGGSVNTTDNQIALYGTALTGHWTAAASGDFATPTGKYTVADGNWNTTTTWNGGAVPAVDADVLILHNINLNGGTRSAANLTIASGGRLYDNNNTSSVLSLSGTLTNSGILYDQHTGGANIFTGKITNNAGAVFSVSSTSNTVSAGIENNGTFSIANATFSANQTLTGSSKITINGSLVIPGSITVTNQGSVYLKDLDGTNAGSTWLNDVNSLLELDISHDTNVPMRTFGTLDADQTNNTVTYLRANKQYVKNQTYWHLSVGGGNTKTLNSNAAMTIKGDLIVPSGTTLTLAAADATPTITIEGKLNNSGTITFWTSATRYFDLLLTGSGEIITGTGSTTLGKLTADNVGSKTSSGNHSINFSTASGGFINNGGAFNGTTNLIYTRTGTLAQQIGGTGDLTTSGTLTVGANGTSYNQVTQIGNVTVGTLAMNCGSSGFYDVAGYNFTLSGFSSPNGGDNIRFSTTSDLTINGTNAVNINRVNQTGTYNNLRNLTINNTNASIATTKVKVNNTLTLAQGTFTNSSATIEMADGAKIVRSGGSITNAPTIATGKISVEYTGNTEKTAGNELVTNKLSNIKVLEGHLFLNAATLTTDATEVSVGAKLTLNSGKALTSGVITLKSSETNGTATFVDANTEGNLTTTTANVEQYVTAGRNWYVSSPVNNATSNAFAANITNPMYWYNETLASNFWVSISDNTTTLNPKQGYICNVATSGIKTLSGTSLNTGSLTASALTKTTSVKGFHLLGNPYPSYFDWEHASTVKTNLNTSIWYRTKSSLDNKYYFETYSATNHEGTNLSGNSDGLVTRYIPPMQSFWVRVETAPGSLAFTNAARAHEAGTNRLKVASSSKENNNQVVRLQISGSNAKDETLVIFNENASNLYDTWDSPKMPESDNSIPQIYTQVANETLTMNGLKSLTDGLTIPLGFANNADETKQLQITATEIRNFEADVRIVLQDNKFGTEQELKLGEPYSFSSEKINTIDRFTIVFRAPSSPNAVNTVEKLNAQVYVNAANQITIVAPEKSNYAIYNAVGQLMENGKTTSNYQTSNLKLSNGVYVVKVGSYSTRVIVK